MTMPAFNYRIINEVTGLDLKGYLYQRNLIEARKAGKVLATKFGKSARLLNVVAAKVTMPKKTRR